MIEFQSVSKTYRDGTTAVDDLTLQIPSDKITVIVGPSGCGKTTTLRMVNRMLEPTKGQILWDGDPLRSKRKTSLRRQMGYVIQNGGLFPHRTVVDNVTTVPGLLGWDKAKSRTRALELLRAVGLDTKLNTRYPAQLSGGQQQRVGVARALAADPIVLLMDEPFSAVDPVVRVDLHDLLLGLQSELSKTIVMITHDIDEAIKLGDQVAILRVGGKLAQVGTPQQVLDEPADAFVEGFVGKDRGYRALSFSPASGLSLDRVRVVREAIATTDDEPVLVVDGEGRPVGWVDRNRPGQTLGLGSTFDPDHDTLRVALDSALTSPVGLAVAVSRDTGRYAGTVTASDILADVTESRAHIADRISGRQRGDGDVNPTDHAPNPDGGGQHDRSQDSEDRHEIISPPPGDATGAGDTSANDVAGAEPEAGLEERDDQGERQNEQVEVVSDPTTQQPSDAEHPDPEHPGPEHAAPEYAEAEHTEAEHAEDEHTEEDRPTTVRSPIDSLTGRSDDHHPAGDGQEQTGSTEEPQRPGHPS